MVGNRESPVSTGRFSPVAHGHECPVREVIEDVTMRFAKDARRAVRGGQCDLQIAFFNILDRKSKRHMLESEIISIHGEGSILGGAGSNG